MKTANVHASCVALGRRGVLLLGASGAGKSDLALRLIEDGARLVADDRTDLFVVAGRLRARPPASIAGLIEVRGLGIIALPYVKSVPVALVVRLGQTPARLPRRQFYAAPFKGAAPVPLIAVDAFAASAPARIRLALAAFFKGLLRDSFNYP